MARARPVPRDPPVTKQCYIEISGELSRGGKLTKMTLPRGSHFLELENHMLYTADVTTRKAAATRACELNAVVGIIWQEKYKAEGVSGCRGGRRGSSGTVFENKARKELANLLKKGWAMGASSSQPHHGRLMSIHLEPLAATMSDHASPLPLIPRLL